jgi:pimeloyl-ACP methyl ester carboxylesterase
MLRTVTPNAISDHILAGLERPAYEKIRVPALAIYQPNDLRFTYPNYDRFDESNRRRADEANEQIRAWTAHSIAQFREEVAGGRVVVLNTGSHYVFVTNEAEVIRLTRDFLSSVRNALD